MKNKKIIKNIFMVALSDFSTIFSGVLIGFILPKIMSVENYGYYKTFTLYCTYTGLFSLGIIDGIVLKFGEKDYEDLNRRKFRSYFKWYLAIHIIFCCIFIGIGINVNSAEYRDILIFLGMYIIAGNITGYFQQLSQITQRFKEYSVRKLLQSIFNIALICGLYILFLNGYEIDYKIYIFLWVIINILLSIWYMFTYRDIIFGASKSCEDTAGEIVKLIQNGVPLLFANLCSTLILTLDSQFVSVLFDTRTYAIYAFAYNLLSLVTVATSAISTVLFPAMKRTDKQNLNHNYSKMVSIILILIFGIIAIYFPLCIFIKWFLPQYTGSLIIFRVIFPGIAISSAVTVIMHNYYKVSGKNFLYFKKSFITLIISAIANIIAYRLFRTSVSISVASIVTMVFWYIFVDSYFTKNKKCNPTQNLIYILGMLIIFYSISSMKNSYSSCVIYCIMYIVFTAIMFKNIFISIISK